MWRSADAIANFPTGAGYRYIMVLVLGLLLVSRADADHVELPDGSKLEGTITEIRKSDREFDFTASSTGTSKTYPFADVHAVSYKGRRFLLKAPSSSESPNASPATVGKDGSDSAATAGDELKRSRKEVLKLIATVGSTPPDWYASTQTNYPESLELDWPLKAEGPWNESKNVGQFIWGRINPNEKRWRPGIKLVHEIMPRHKGDRKLLQRDMEKLGDMYFVLLQDYPRAAFWLQKSKPSVVKKTGIHLAECYWRLGNRDMALAMMKGKKLNVDAIKLLGDMGEVEDALNVAAYYGKTSLHNEAHLNVGDALRTAGRLDEAVNYYQKVLDADRARNEQYKARYLARARGSIEAIRLYDKAKVSRVADGTYVDTSTAYNGELEVKVVVANSKITDVKVTRHKEKQFYAALIDTTAQIIERQGIRDIDATSGATITSQAIVHATARALAQGAR